jgi:hypothetical protein
MTILHSAGFAMLDFVCLWFVLALVSTSEESVRGAGQIAALIALAVFLITL